MVCKPAMYKLVTLCSYRIGLAVAEIIAHCESEAHFHDLCSPASFHLPSHLTSHQAGMLAGLSTSPAVLHSHLQPVALQWGGICKEQPSTGRSVLNSWRSLAREKQKSGLWCAAQELSAGMLSNSYCSDAFTWPMPSSWPGPGRTFPGWCRQLCLLGHEELAKWSHGAHLICCVTADPLWFR